MFDGVVVVVSLAGSLAAVVSAAVSIHQLRLDSQGSGKSVPPPYRPFRRLTRPLSVLVGALILAAVSVLLLWQVLSSSGDGSTEASRVLHQLNIGEEKDCESASPVAGGVAALSCSRGDGPVSNVTITLFSTVDALESSQRAAISERGMTKGSCFSQTMVWEESDKGVLLCDYGDEGERASMQWSRTDSKVLIQATAAPDAEPGEIYEWWRSDKTGSPNSRRLPYPDAIESYILELADRRAGQCERATRFWEELGAIECEAAVPDFLFLAYFGDDLTLGHSLQATELSEGSCVDYKYVPAVKRYEIAGEDVGLRQCNVDSEEQKSVVKWFNEDTRLYGYAEVRETDGSLQSLFRWWLTRGRFLTAE